MSQMSSQKVAHKLQIQTERLNIQLLKHSLAVSWPIMPAYGK